LYKMGREEWLKRFLDVEGTYQFELVMKKTPWQDLYVTREGCNVEVHTIWLKENSDLTPASRSGFLAVGMTGKRHQVYVTVFSLRGSGFLSPHLILAEGGVAPHCGFVVRAKALQKAFGITNDGRGIPFYQLTGRELRMSTGRKIVFGARTSSERVRWGICGMRGQRILGKYVGEGVGLRTQHWFAVNAKRPVSFRIRISTIVG
jgi:hypothetical protein